MIETVLPAATRSAEFRGDRAPDALVDDEWLHIANAVRKRQREFVTTRVCARDALEALGAGRPPIPRDESGRPVWPDGIVGSLTHCLNYRAAAVARERDLIALGIDAEPHRRLRAGFSDLITVPNDIAGLRALETPELFAPLVLFCAKEAVYKAWHPLTGKALGFRDLSVTLQPDGTFGVLPEGDRAGGADVLTAMRGRWRISEGIVVASAVIMAPR